MSDMQVSAKTGAQMPERPAAWYYDGRQAAAAQVEAECALPVPLHHVEVTGAHGPTVGNGQ